MLVLHCFELPREVLPDSVNNSLKSSRLYSDILSLTTALNPLNSAEIFDLLMV